MPFDWPLKLLLILTGKFPYKLKKVQDGFKVKHSMILVIFAIGLNITMIGQCIWRTLENPIPSSSNITTILQYLNITSWYFGCSNISLWTMFSMKAQVAVHTRLYDLYKEVYEKISEEDAKKENKRVLIISTILFLFFISSITIVAIDIIQFRPIARLATVVSVISNFLATAIEIYSFQFTLCRIVAKCSNLLEFSVTEIEEVKQIYLSTVEINQHFNNVYGKRCFILITSSIIVITWYIFELGRKYIFKHPNDATYGYIISAFVFGFIIIILSYVGSLKHEIASKLLLKIRRISSESRGPIKHQYQELIDCIKDLPMNLSAGLFNIDFSFLTAIIGNIITYLIILLQFA